MLSTLKNIASAVSEFIFLLTYSWFAEEIEEDEHWLPYLKLGYWEGVTIEPRDEEIVTYYGLTLEEAIKVAENACVIADYDYCLVEKAIRALDLFEYVEPEEELESEWDEYIKNYSDDDIPL